MPSLPAGWSVSGSGASRAYSYSGTPTEPSGSQTVTATNGAGLTASNSFTVSADTAAPSGQSVDLSGGPYYTTLSVPLSLANGSDSGSGIDAASGIVERAEATLSNGTCGSFGSYAPVSLSAGADAGVLSGNCYRYRYLISDK